MKKSIQIKNINPFVIPISIFLFSLILHSSFILLYAVNSLAGGDSIAYLSFAEGIVNGNGFRSGIEPWLADRPPLYPHFLATIFFFFGKNHEVIYFIQALFFAASAGVFSLAAMKMIGLRRGVFTGLLYSITPHFMLFSKQILGESIYIVILIFIISILILNDKAQDKLRYSIIIGFLLGLISLIRREALLPASVIIFSVYFYRYKSNFKLIFKYIIIILLISSLVILPWIIRNWNLLGKPIMSSSSGYNFMVGNNPNATGGYSLPPDNWLQQINGTNELDRDEISWRLSISWLRTNPEKVFPLIIKKLKTNYGSGNNRILDGFDFMLLILSSMGMYHIAKKKNGWKYVLILFLSLSISNLLMSILFVGGWRYRIIIYPGLILLAGFGVPDSFFNYIEKQFYNNVNQFV